MGKWGVAIALFLLAGCDAVLNDASLIDACKPGDDVICGVDRPEDLEIIPGSRWLMVAELGTPPKAGHVSIVDPDTKERRVISDNVAPTETETFPRCGEAPKELHPRGFHLSAAEDGSERLYLINQTRVERYRVTVSGDDVTLAWEGCVTIPQEVAANDIASLGDKGFVLSHMLSGRREGLTNLKLVLGIGDGAAYRWTRDGGWARIPNSTAAFGNGIQVDPKTGRIYLSSMFAQRILAFDLDGSNFASTGRNPNQVDNLSWTEDGRLLMGVGHTGIGIYGTSACRVGRVCSFPFAVTTIDPSTLKVATIFESKKGIPGASTAILKGGYLYFGTSFGDRITRVKLNAAATADRASSARP